ncbi:MAG: hypothetical protein IPN46_19490 [Saprospiraceae bacterium]|nr:hypothetical protein [Saprospiraceae bacterium]
MNHHLGYNKGDKPANDNIRNGYSVKTLKTPTGDQLISVSRDWKVNLIQRSSQA